MQESRFHEAALKVNEVEKDMSKSIETMKKAMLIIQKLFQHQNLSIVPVEGVNAEACITLDTRSGIDYLVVNDRDGHVYGVAWRAQPDNNKHYQTFTIRKSRDSGAATEFEKRKDAIKKNALHPRYTMQAYTDPESGKIVRLALTTTESLIRFIENEDPAVRHTHSDKIGQAEFYIVSWLDMKKKGYYIAIYDNDSVDVCNLQRHSA